jgi:inhibitor of KinA
MSFYHPYSLFPLGDAAILIDFGNTIDEAVNKNVIRLYRHLQKKRIPFITDFVPAYSSLTLYYDALLIPPPEGDRTNFDVIAEIIEAASEDEPSSMEERNRLLRIPVCYSENFAQDIETISRQNGVAVEDIVELHTSKVYLVYMIGFLPGFAYMGEVDERIAIPRKAIPAPVVPGAVGIAGRQTGIYPFHSPGGWHIIGRSPLPLFDKKRPDPVLLESGDRVQFYAITEDEFTDYQTGHS